MYIAYVKMNLDEFFLYLEKREVISHNVDNNKYEIYKSMFCEKEKVIIEVEDVHVTNYGRIYMMYTNTISSLDFWITDYAKKYMDKFITLYNKDSFEDDFIYFMEHIKIKCTVQHQL